MADFAAPSGPPPPKVPEGWKAVWNDQYKEWFYVNIHTKKSQWDKPTEPVYPASSDGVPDGPPPSYDQHTSQSTQPEKGGFATNNPFNARSQDAGSGMSEDEKLARKLQSEDQSGAGGSGTSDRGAADSYYGSGGPAQNAPYGQSASASPSPYGQQALPPRDANTSKGFFSKLSSKLGGPSGSRPPQAGGYGGYPQQRPPQQQYGGYPQQYPPQQQYGGYPPQQYGGYPPQQQQQQQSKHGLGALGMGAGGAVLGAGAGLVGGALLMDAFEDHDQNEYQQGYDAGADNGGDDGGDFGGDGGDFGGDF